MARQMLGAAPSGGVMVRPSADIFRDTEGATIAAPTAPPSIVSNPPPTPSTSMQASPQASSTLLVAALLTTVGTASALPTNLHSSPSATPTYSASYTGSPKLRATGAIISAIVGAAATPSVLPNAQDSPAQSWFYCDRRIQAGLFTVSLPLYLPEEWPQGFPSSTPSQTAPVPSSSSAPPPVLHTVSYCVSASPPPAAASASPSASADVHVKPTGTPASFDKYNLFRTFFNMLDGSFEGWLVPENLYALERRLYDNMRTHCDFYAPLILLQGRSGATDARKVVADLGASGAWLQASPINRIQLVEAFILSQKHSNAPPSPILFTCFSRLFHHVPFHVQTEHGIITNRYNEGGKIGFTVVFVPRGGAVQRGFYYLAAAPPTPSISPMYSQTAELAPSPASPSASDITYTKPTALVAPPTPTASAALPLRSPTPPRAPSEDGASDSESTVPDSPDSAATVLDTDGPGLLVPPLAAAAAPAASAAIAVQPASAFPSMPLPPSLDQGRAVSPSDTVASSGSTVADPQLEPSSHCSIISGAPTTAEPSFSPLPSASRASTPTARVSGTASPSPSTAGPQCSPTLPSAPLSLVPEYDSQDTVPDSDATVLDTSTMGHPAPEQGAVALSPSPAAHVAPLPAAPNASSVVSAAAMAVPTAASLPTRALLDPPPLVLPPPPETVRPLNPAPPPFVVPVEYDEFFSATHTETLPPILRVDPVVQNSLDNVKRIREVDSMTALAVKVDDDTAKSLDMAAKKYRNQCLQRLTSLQGADPIAQQLAVQSIDNRRIKMCPQEAVSGVVFI